MSNSTSSVKKMGIFTETHLLRPGKGHLHLSRRERAKVQKHSPGTPEHRLCGQKTDCQACELRSLCTSNKMGRTVKRHLRQDDLDDEASKPQCRPKRDIKKRQHLMERSFARGKRYSYDRARWRGLWKVQIQEYLTCVVQNIQVLLSWGEQAGKNPAVTVRVLKPSLFEGLFSFSIVLRQIRLPLHRGQVKCLA